MRDNEGTTSLRTENPQCAGAGDPCVDTALVLKLLAQDEAWVLPLREVRRTVLAISGSQSMRPLDDR